MAVVTGAFRPLLTLTCALLLTACSPGKAPTRSIEQASTGFYSAALSNDGRLAVVGSIYQGGSLWDLRRSARLFSWNHKAGEQTALVSTAISPEGNFALTTDATTLVLWKTDTGEALSFASAPSEILDSALGSNGDYALLGMADATAAIFDVKHGGVKRTFYHQDRVQSVALNTQAQLALTGSEDGTAVLWNLQDGKELQRWQHSDEVLTVALSPDGRRAFTMGKYDRAVIWDTQTGKAIGELPLKASALRRGESLASARFSSDGKQLLTGNADRQVQLWQIDGMRELAHWELPKRDAWKPTGAAVLDVAFGPSGSYFAAASNGFSHELKR